MTTEEMMDCYQFGTVPKPTQAEEHEALVADLRSSAFREWDKFAHSPRIEDEPGLDRALRGFDIVARAVLAVIAEKATKGWPTEAMTEQFLKYYTLTADDSCAYQAKDVFRALFAASPLVKPEPVSGTNQ